MTSSSPMAPTPQYPSARYAWYVVFVLLIVGVTSYLDRFLISLLVEPIKADLGINDTQVSLLQGAAFAVFYVAFGLPLGALVDRANRRNILAVGIAVWSLMTVACGLADSYWTLFLARAGVGIGEACLAPAAYSLLSDYFHPSRRGRAMSVYNMSNYLGVGASLLVGGVILKALGGAVTSSLPLVGTVASWKAAFFVVGAPGLLLSLLMLTIREESRKIPAGMAIQAKATFADFLVHLRSARAAYGAVYFVSAMTAFVGLTFAAWGPSFFIRTYQLAPGEVGLMIGPVSALGGVLGCLASGFVSDRLVNVNRAGGRFNIPLLWWPLAFVGLLGLVAAPSLPWALVALGVISFGSGLGLASVPPTIHDITPNRLRGRATVLHFIFAGVLGMGLAPTLIALVTDHIFKTDAALRSSLMVVLIPVIVASFLTCWFGRRAYETARQRFSDGVVTEKAS